MAVSDIFVDGALFVTTGVAGNSTPASGTSETWTVVALSSLWPALSNGETITVQDVAAPSEIIRMTASTGSGATSVTVTRGADGTTPVTHDTGASFLCTVVSSSLNNFLSAYIVTPSMSNTKIQAQITAAEAVTGTVWVGPGLYAGVTQWTITAPITLQFSGEAVTTLTAATGAAGPILNFNAAAQIAVSVKGGVTINMNAAESSAQAVLMNNLANVEQFEDINVINGQAVGFTVTNCNAVHSDRLSVFDAVKGWSVNGDNSAEMFWRDCSYTCSLSGTTATAAFECDRTATTDVGGHYLTRFRVTRGLGTINNGILFTNSAGSLDFSPLFLDHCISDNINGSGSAYSIHQKQDVFMTGGWGTHATGNTNPVIVSNGCKNLQVSGGYYLAADGICLDLQNGTVNVAIGGGVQLDGGSCTAIGCIVGTAPTGIILGNVQVTATTFTNSANNLAEGAAYNPFVGMAVYTSGGSGASQTFQLVDGNAGGNMCFRMDGSGNLQVLPGSFASVIFELTSSGQAVFENGVSPGNFGTAVSGNRLWQGSGVPSNSSGSNGDAYLRTDGSTGTHLYFKSSGTWAGII